MNFLSKVMAIAGKDIRSEMRTREIVTSVLVFTLLVIVIFSFAFAASQETMALVAPGILWATFAFAGVLALNRAFIPEKEEDCMEGLLACPVSREAIYVGKLLGSTAFMLAIEVIALPVFALLFNLPVLSGPVITVTFLTTIGFAAVGTLFSAVAVNTKAREMVLPVLFLPVVVPIIIAAVKASGLALLGTSWSGLTSWLQIIGVFDVIFLVVSFWVFSFIVEE